MFRLISYVFAMLAGGSLVMGFYHTYALNASEDAVLLMCLGSALLFAAAGAYTVHDLEEEVDEADERADGYARILDKIEEQTPDAYERAIKAIAAEDKAKVEAEAAAAKQ